MDTGRCLDCGSEVAFSKEPNMGALVTCSRCGTELQIVWLNPLELDWPFIDDDEDDDDDDYDDDDDFFDYND